MLEIKQPGTRYSAYYNGRNKAGTATTLSRGMFVQMTGVATVALGGGGPRFADSGDQLMCAANNTDTELAPVYPCNLIIFKDDGSDINNDTIASGQELIYYQGGEYETDQYGVVTGGTFGTYLFLDPNCKLTTSGSGAAVAIWINRSTTFDSNYSATGMLWFRMLEFPVNMSGGSLRND